MTEKNNPNSKNVFISYSHRDRDACARIDSLLEKRDDFNVWYDKGLIPGEVYRRRIAEVIRNSGYFIILLSQSSVASDWVIDEVEYAKKLHKRILPIWLENVDIPDDLDMILQRYHSLFWHLRSSDSQFEESLMSMFDPVEEKSVGQALVGFGNEYSERVNAEMRDLLAKERQHRFSDLYAPENACILGTAYLTWDDPDEKIYRPIVKRIRSLADDGCLPAKLYMGNLYWYGRFGVEADKAKSAELYEECARLGNARAQFVMSSNYYYGDGVERDYELAKMYANLALEQKYIYAWRRWGKFYRDGKAVEQDFTRARECYEKGAQMGDYNCYNKIGDMFYHGWGCDVDYAAAVEYFRKGEQAPLFGQRYSLQRAKTALGRAYEKGQGVEQDLAAAAQKYLEGYEAGSLECRDAYLRCSQQHKDEENA